MASRRSVVVAGVDGSASSAAALVHACDEARARGGSVEMVTAWPIPPVESRVGDSMGYRAGHSWAVWAQTAAVTLLRRSVLDVPPLTGVVVEGSPADVLARAGEGTAGIVLGHRPDDPSTAAASSTRERCMALATCPVVVVPDLPGRPPVQDGGSGVDTTARRRSAATRAGSRVPA